MTQIQTSETKVQRSEAEWRAHMQGAALQRFSATGAPKLIADFQLFRMRMVEGGASS